MPYDITDLQSNVAECTSELGITLTYRLANVTERTLAHLRILEDKADQDGERNLKAMTDVLARLVITWDLTDHGEPVPVTREGIADVPADIRADVLAAIVKDAQVDPTTGTVSQPASPATTARSAKSSSRKRG